MVEAAPHRLLSRASLAHEPECSTFQMTRKVLGRKILSTTADIYSHLAPEAFQEAADAMERALG